MKKFLITISIIIGVVLIGVIVLGVTGVLEDITTNSFRYEENGIKYRLYRGDNTAEVIESPNASGKIVIPSIVNHKNKEYVVTTIGYSAFKENNNIQEVYISEGIKTIKDHAFSSFSISKISIPNSLEFFGSSCLGENIEITTYQGYKYLGNDENPYVILLDSTSEAPDVLTIPDGVKIINDIDDRTVKVILSNSVVTLEDMAFDDCKLLKEVVIDEDSNLKNIMRAFHNCVKLKSLYIPKYCTQIVGTIGSYDAKNTRYYSQLESIIVDPANPIYDSRQDCNAIIDTATNTLIWGCKNTVIPTSVTAIGNAAFSGIEFLDKRFDLPDSLIKIGNYAFSCSNLATMKLPKNIESIGESVFRDCLNLEELIINQNIKTIGSLICYECDNLKKLVVPFIGKSFDATKKYERSLIYFFDYANSGYSIYMPELSLYINSNSNYTIKKNTIKGRLKGLYLLGNVTTINKKALALEKIEEIYLSANVNTIKGKLNVDDLKNDKDRKIYCESQGMKDGWHKDWNNLGAFVEFGYDFSKIYEEINDNN